MIGLENVSVVFNQGSPDENMALSRTNLAVNEGDFVTVIGSNGAGKSTLFSAIAGSIPIVTGKISINGVDVSRQPEHKRASLIGRVFQNPLLGTAGNMSLEDNMVIASRKGMKWPVVSLSNKRRAYFKEQLCRLEMKLEERLSENMQRFSGGQRQAITLLMTVLSRPALILLDEHTAALDPRNAERILALTDSFIREYELTAMMITHNMRDAITYGNRLLMMDKGEIILDVSGTEKKSLTVEKLISKFHELRHADFGNDRSLLA